LLHLGCWWTAVKATVTLGNPYANACIMGAATAALITSGAAAGPALTGCAVAEYPSVVESSSHEKIEKSGLVVEELGLIHDLIDIVVDAPKAVYNNKQQVKQVAKWLNAQIKKKRR